MHFRMEILEKYFQKFTTYPHHLGILYRSGCRALGRDHRFCISCVVPGDIPAAGPQTTVTAIRGYTRYTLTSLYQDGFWDRSPNFEPIALLENNLLFCRKFEIEFCKVKYCGNVI